jgi:hypothetical protein
MPHYRALANAQVAQLARHHVYPPDRLDESWLDLAIGNLNSTGRPGRRSPRQVPTGGTSTADRPRRLHQREKTQPEGRHDPSRGDAPAEAVSGLQWRPPPSLFRFAPVRTTKRLCSRLGRTTATKPQNLVLDQYHWALDVRDHRRAAAMLPTSVRCRSKAANFWLVFGSVTVS